MVWVHGGSFLSGSGAGSLYRGGLLAREGDVVVVTINYRLGLLGFLAHPALEVPDQAWLEGEEWTGFGNWGLADQIAALRWVRGNIGGFGGDPANVTVFGESAGGMSISSLLGAPAARGLFHRAIVESGPPYTQSVDQSVARAEELAGYLGVEVSRGALEQVPADALVAAATDVGGRRDGRGQSGLLMTPTVDGGLLSSPPEVEVASGSASDVALLIGTNRDETSFFTVGSGKFAALDEPGLRDWVSLLIPDSTDAASVIARVRQARLGRGEDATPRHLWTAISSEFLFRWPTIRLANAHAASAGPGVGTYCYLFTWESPAFGGYLGSCHALEIPFVLGTVHLPGVQQFSGGGDEVFALSAAMRRDWVAFARSGSPEGPGGPRGPGGWSVWDTERRPTMVFGPWPGEQGLQRQVDAPRDEELEAIAAATGTRIT
jgi:para-nitrobenzyl esterase